MTRAPWHHPECVAAPHCRCAEEEIERLRAALAAEREAGRDEGLASAAAYVAAISLPEGPEFAEAQRALDAAPASPPPASLSIQAAQLGIRSPLTAEPAPASPPGDLGTLAMALVRAVEDLAAVRRDKGRDTGPEAKRVDAARAAVLAWGERAGEWEERCRRVETQANRQLRRADAAEAEVSRLRAALGDLLSACTSNPGAVATATAVARARALIPGAGAARSPGSGGAGEGTP